MACAPASSKHIYFELEALEEQRSEGVQRGGLSISLPEGARFPVVQGRGGLRWSLSDTEPSDSRAEVTALRVSPDQSRLATIVTHPGTITGKISELSEIDLRSGAQTKLQENVYDAVYLNDGRILATLLKNEQPRSAVIIDHGQVNNILTAPAQAFLKLSTQNPSRILIQSWDEKTNRLFNVVASSVDDPKDRSKRLPEFGCGENRMHLKDVSCNQEKIMSLDGTSVPITIFRGRSNTNQHTLIKVYGAYGQVLSSDLSLAERYLLRHGFTIVLAHVRGGGELGPEWHAAGRGAARMRGVEDLIGVINQFGKIGDVALEASSAGAIIALNAAVRSSQVSSMALLSPLLDIDRSIKQFPDDLPEFEFTPEVLKPLGAAPLKNLPPTLLVCGDSDAFAPAQECESFARRGPPGLVTLWIEARQEHLFTLSRTEELKRATFLVDWLLHKMP